jgi:hypothetical protein
VLIHSLALHTQNSAELIITQIAPEPSNQWKNCRIISYIQYFSQAINEKYEYVFENGIRKVILNCISTIHNNYFSLGGWQ